MQQAKQQYPHCNLDFVQQTLHKPRNIEVIKQVTSKHEETKSSASLEHPKDAPQQLPNTIIEPTNRTTPHTPITTQEEQPLLVCGDGCFKLFASDMNCLKPKQWLSDAVINCYLELYVY